MTEKEYRAAEGVNKSTLWNMTRSPAHYKYYLDNPTEDTQSFRFGRAVHAAILTPTAYKRDFAIMPDGLDKRTKTGRELYSGFIKTAGERDIITFKESMEVKAISKAVRKCTAAAAILKGTRREKPLFWTDNNGILCKCRIDAYRPGLIIDLKTASDASTEAFTREAIRYGYHVQAAHYIDGYQHTQSGEPPEWYFVVVEKEPPYAVNILKADQSFIDYGIKIRNRLIKQLMQCQENNSFPGYGENIIAAPIWAE